MEKEIPLYMVINSTIVWPGSSQWPNMFAVLMQFDK